ncbi:MAG TPA: chemotaxis protein CheB [Polyangiales bacterium]|nr:chemotaxis protein CheB [Polyangiales bacterium]
MARRDIVVIGASAGGVEPLVHLSRLLPADLPAALLVVLHVPPHGSVLPRLLARAGRLPGRHAEQGQTIEQGRFYVAPPDHHLLVRPNGTIHLGRGATENGHRPAIDPMFRSAARAFGPRVIGMVLSGSLDDGTAGLLAVKLSGGLALVQDPAEALHSSMPASALENVEVDAVGSVDELARRLVELVGQPTDSAEGAMATELEETGDEVASPEDGTPALAEAELHGATPSAFTCPDCSGVLWELREKHLVRYRCRVGHAYLPRALTAAQAERVEESLWIALRTLRESSALSKRLAERARERRMLQVAATYDARVAEASRRAEVIEDVLRRGRLSTGLEDAISAEVEQEPAGDAAER